MRVPENRPPTHPGEMLLEEFIKPLAISWNAAQAWLNLQTAWDLYHAKHSPAAKQIERIRRHPALAGTRR